MRIVVLQPTYRFIPTESYQSMVNLLYHFIAAGHVIQYAISDHIKIDHVRNHLVNEVLKSGMSFDYILWVDSDQVFSPKHVEKLIDRIKNDNLDIVSGKYYKRRGYKTEVVAFEDMGDKFISIAANETGLQEVEAVGFGFILMKQEVIEKMAEKYGMRQFEFQYLRDDNEYMSEDINWCIRARDLKYKIWLDNNCVIGHQGAVI